MADVITISGNVKYPITLDPSVWIFDDRKFKMPDALDGKKDKQILTTATAIPQQWERELQDKEIPSIKSESLFVHQKDIDGSYGMKLEPFLEKAEPLDNVQHVKCHLNNGEHQLISLDEAKHSILLFALNSKPIRGKDGPVYLYFADGSNRDNPVKGINKMELL